MTVTHYSSIFAMMQHANMKGTEKKDVGIECIFLQQHDVESNLMSRKS